MLKLLRLWNIQNSVRVQTYKASNWVWNNLELKTVNNYFYEFMKIIYYIIYTHIYVHTIILVTKVLML